MLGRLFEQRALSSYPWGPTSPDQPWGYWPGDTTYSTPDPLQLATVLGCVRLISDSISTLPIDVYRKAGDQKIPVTPPDWLVEPIVGIDFATWCGQVLSSLLLHGNAYILVGRSPSSGSILELRPLAPHVVRVDAGRYYVNGAEAEVIHIRGLMLPGSDVGLSPVGLARETIDLGIAALRYGKDTFDADGNMPGVIESPHVMEQGTKRDIALQWQRKRRKGGRGLPGVLDGGATWKPTGMSSEDAQFLATRRYTAAEIAGQIFLLDPADLGIGVEGTSLTYANLEQRNARRVQVTLLPWIARVESGLNRLLGVPLYAKLNVEGLLRGDQKTRFEAYEIGASIGALTVDEIRQLEDRPQLSANDRKQSRSWQEVGLPALVGGGLMTVNESRAQLGLPPIPGGDVLRDPTTLAPIGGNP